MRTSLHAFFPGFEALERVQALEVRVPKRGTRYAAQVWGERGFWLVGLFDSTTSGANAARAFAATAPTEPDPKTPREELPANWHRRRSKSHAPRRKWVRRVKGGGYQARVWLGAAHGSLNLGIFTTADHGENAEWAAGQVSKAFGREWRDGRTIGEVVELLRQSNRLSERVPAHIAVPAHQRDLRPPTDNGPLLSPRERRDAKRRTRVTLADFLTAA